VSQYQRYGESPASSTALSGISILTKTSALVRAGLCLRRSFSSRSVVTNTLGAGRTCIPSESGQNEVSQAKGVNARFRDDAVRGCRLLLSNKAATAGIESLGRNLLRRLTTSTSYPKNLLLPQQLYRRSIHRLRMEQRTNIEETYNLGRDFLASARYLFWKTT
jgi:hypothetical protein